MADHEITCVHKNDRAEMHERITSIGGIDPSDGKRWTLSQQDAIKGISSGKLRFYVMVGGKAVPVVVAVDAWGSKYLKTQTDREQPMNLLNLPECPYF
jgi:hypothetical protein